MKMLLPLTLAILTLACAGPHAFSQPVPPPPPDLPDTPEVLYEGKPARHWLETFKDRSASFRLQAIDALAAIGADDERVVPALIAALNDDSGEVRAAAAGALGKIGPRGGDKVIPALEAAANQSFNRNVRTAALRGLLCAEVGAKLVNDIEDSGGSIEYSAAGRPWIQIQGAGGWSDAEIACLKNLTHLKELWLQNCSVTDAGLEHVAGLKNLQHLMLTSVTNAGLVHLQGLKLESLQLNGMGISDAGLVNIRAMTSLKRLQLNQTAITDKGLACLKELVNLETLDLDGSDKFSDAGLASLKEMIHLNYLSLRGTNVHNAGLEHLKQLTKLTALNAANTYVDYEGIVELRKSLPNIGSDVQQQILPTPAFGIR